MSREVSVVVNGERRQSETDERRSLADFLRINLGLTGTHLGCEHGVCGSCTVLVDGASARSCLMLAVQAQDREITTVEGLASGDQLHRVQEAMAETHAFQCGFCTPGFLMAAVELLEETPSPSEREVREALTGNLCRCTGYESIVAGVLLAAERLA